MKKTILSIAVLAAAIFAASCQKESLQENAATEGSVSVFTATIETVAGTKTTVERVDGTEVIYKTKWESTDKININGETYTATPDGTDATKATFTKVSGEDPTAPFYAYFPETMYSNGKATLPASYTYADGKYNMPMYAAESATTSLSFKNLCGVLAVTVSGADFTSVSSIEVSSDKQMNGEFTATAEGILSFASVTLTDALKKVTLSISPAKSIASDGSATFYIPVPTGTHNPLTIKVSGDATSGDDTRSIVTKNSGGVEVERNNVYPITFFFEYVQIYADYDLNPSTPNTALKWHRQNLAITTSGKMKWKGGNASSAVKVPGLNENVIVGDYFQWGASYPGYSITTETDKKPENLLIYTSFTNTCCLNGGDTNEFIFKNLEPDKKYHFGTNDYGISPYFDKDTGYTKYNNSTQGTLERTPDNDDIASIILGGSWRMPTCADFIAMKDATYWVWDATDMGYYVFSPDETYSAGKASDSIPEALQKADALLFFPAAGYGDDWGLLLVGEGNYWSSDLRPESNNDDYLYPHYLECSSYPNIDTKGYYGRPRYCGMSVRPVSD